MTTCTHCGIPFTPKFPNAKLCYACFLKRERALREIDGLESELAWLRGVVAQQKQATVTPQVQAIPADKLRLMIQLCHPDRHGGSQAATAVTAWLLSERKRSAA